MKHEQIGWSVLVLSIILIPLFTGACGSKKENVPPPGTWGLPRTTPQNVVANLRMAIAERDSLHYAVQLADSFTFVFAPQDVGGPNNTPETWGRMDDTIAMSRMFGGKANRDGYVCDSIALQWVSMPPDTTPELPAWARIVASNVFLTLYCRNKVNGDPLYYLIEGDQEYLWIEKTGSEWRLVRWEDRPIDKRAGMSASTTFGQIKALWR